MNFNQIREALVAARKENEVLRKLLEEGLRAWSFDNRQVHTHTWHERADWEAKVAKATGISIHPDGRR